MQFAQTDDQIAFAAATRGVAARHSLPEDVREAWQTGHPPESLWAGLGDLGLLSILAPEDLGGGGTELELVSALDEVGRAAVPGPVVEHAAVAVPLLASIAPHLLDDEDLLDRGITATTSAVVPYVGSGAALLLGPDRVRLLPLGALTPVESLDGSRAVARLDAETLARAVVVAEGAEVAAVVARAEDRAALATAAVLLGLSARAIEMTVDYASARRQFGVPIGSFQAVKHHLANAHIAVDMSRPLVQAAAWAMSVDDVEASRLCSMAKVTANKAARTAAKASLQCHGAIGYTMEADLHLYLMRIWSLLNAWGTTDLHLDRVAGTWK